MAARAAWQAYFRSSVADLRNKPQLTDLIFCCPYYDFLEGEPNIVDNAKLVLCIIEITMNNDPNNNEQE